MTGEILNCIGGAHVPARSGRWLPNFEPATGKEYSRIPDSDEADVSAAILAAQKASRGWSRTSAADRARVLRRISEAITLKLELLARAESIDSGKPLELARRIDIPR